MKKPIKKQFIDFLKREGVIERYKRNWLFCDSYNHAKPIKNKNHYISFAFLWQESPEGREFWSEISKKWLELI